MITLNEGTSHIYTLDGDDFISSSNASLNKIYAGAGSDTIAITGNGMGTNTIYTHTDGINSPNLDSQNDTNTVTVTGDSSNDIYGGVGNDTITITGNGNNTISLGDGTNIVTISGNGTNNITTGDGNDTITITGSGKATVNAGLGNDTIETGSGNDIIYTNNSKDSDFDTIKIYKFTQNLTKLTTSNQIATKKIYNFKSYKSVA